MSEQQSNGHAGPALDRPRMPEGYGVPASGEGMLPWRHASERLAGALNYWIGTTRPDGRPHAVPVWGAWVDRALYFEGGGGWSSYLKTNPAIAVHLESGDEVVIVEGMAAPVVELAPAVFARVVDSFGAKYDHRPEQAAGMWTARPRIVLAWHRFPKDATRWRFDRD